MPIYCYKCDKCDFEFEEIKKTDEKMDIFCPNCGEEKEISAVPTSGSFILKGEGWSR